MPAPASNHAVPQRTGIKWSFRIARVFGIDIRVHIVFLLVPLIIAFQNADAGFGMALAAGLYTLMAFAFVLFHELGHSLVARRFGVGVCDITLLPIGGMARLTHIPEDPATELKIAIAGPLVNLGFVALLMPPFFVAFAGSYGGFRVLPQGPADVLLALIIINGVLAIFNLVPAFPMDGGRILRALLACFLPYVRATRIAAITGRVLSVGLFVLGMSTGSWIAMLVAFFVFMAGTAEYRMVRMRHAARQMAAQNAAPTPPQEEAAHAFESLARNYAPGPDRRDG